VTLNLINGSLSNIPVGQRIENLTLELSVATAQADVLTPTYCPPAADEVPVLGEFALPSMTISREAGIV
jgi:hypothetical protein